MEDYFDQFKGFKYNPSVAPEDEWKRLQAFRRWGDGTKTYYKQRYLFMSALATKSGSPVHWYFVNHHFVQYDSTANPRAEFERFAQHNRWNKSKPAYKAAKLEFNIAFEKEFGAEVLDFFDEYKEKGFDYNPRASAVEELHRMADFFDWPWNSQGWRTARDTFYEAIAIDFNQTFGDDDGDLSGWTFLCTVLGVPSLKATTAEECRKALEDKHVNIYDILDFVRDGMPSHKPLKFHETVKELSDYSYNSEPSRIYPSEMARRGSLKFVLRGIGEFHALDKEKDKPKRAPKPKKDDTDNKKRPKRKGGGAARAKRDSPKPQNGEGSVGAEASWNTGGGLAEGTGGGRPDPSVDMVASSIQNLDIAAAPICGHGGV